MVLALASWQTFVDDAPDLAAVVERAQACTSATIELPPR